MRRVLFYIWSLGVGGAEKHTLDLAAALRRRGVDARVLVHRGACDPALNPDPELPIVQLNGGGFFGLRDWTRAWAAIRSLSPDVVVGVNPSATIAAAAGAIAGRARAKVMSVFHTTKLGRRAYWLKILIYMALTARGRTVFCSANQLRYWRSRGFPGPSQVITTGSTSPGSARLPRSNAPGPEMPWGSRRKITSSAWSPRSARRRATATCWPRSIACGRSGCRPRRCWWATGPNAKRSLGGSRRWTSAPTF